MSVQFDQSPTLYWLIGYGWAFLLVLVWWKWPSTNKSWVLTLGVLALLLWMRLPVLVFNQEIDPDESQMLGHALTLREDPVYWQSVDGQTIGPLDSYVLLLPSFLGFDLDYTAARAIGLLCLFGSLFFFFRSVRSLIGSEAVWVAVFPLVFFLAFIQEGDFVHYSSEQLPLFLLSGSLWLFLQQSKQPKRIRWFWLGFVLSLLPFCKLQAVPIGLVIGLFALVKAYSLPATRWYSIGALVGGALFFPLAVLVWAWNFQVWDDFWTFYIQGNLIYAGKQSFLQSLGLTLDFLKASPGFSLYLLSLIPLLGWGIKKSKWKTETWLALLMVLAGYYAVIKTGNIFPHYLNFLLYPLSFFAAVLGQEAIKRQGLGVGVWILLVWMGGLTYRQYDGQPLNRYVSTQTSVPISSVSELILRHAAPPDRMAIWGWMGKYHVETQLPQGATEAHTERCMFEHPLREAYYQRFLNDLREKKPRIFVDAVGPRSLWVQDRATQGHEAFPELKSWIEAHYRLVGEVDFTRVYVRP